jgi:protein-L-isoaspartate(D-aspartate) O-methyltransferase
MNKIKLIGSLIKQGILKTQLIIEAFNKIERANFVPAQYIKEAYNDYPLPIGFNQTISQPLTVAFMLELLNPRPGEKILEIGAGSGWVTALLAYCVSYKNSNGKVIAIERIKELQEMAYQNVSRYNFIEKGIVEIILGDGSKGFQKYAPYDKIIAAASAKFIPVAWKNELKIGGTLVAPVKNTLECHKKINTNDFNIKIYKGFSFVPLVIDKENGNNL